MRENMQFCLSPSCYPLFPPLYFFFPFMPLLLQATMYIQMCVFFNGCVTVSSGYTALTCKQITALTCKQIKHSTRKEWDHFRGCRQPPPNSSKKQVSMTKDEGSLGM